MMTFAEVTFAEAFAEVTAVSGVQVRTVIVGEWQERRKGIPSEAIVVAQPQAAIATISSSITTVSTKPKSTTVPTTSKSTTVPTKSKSTVSSITTVSTIGIRWEMCERVSLVVRSVVDRPLGPFVAVFLAFILVSLFGRGDGRSRNYEKWNKDPHGVLTSTTENHTAILVSLFGRGDGRRG